MSTIKITFTRDQDVDARMEAIRKACSNIGSFELTGMRLHKDGEPDFNYGDSEQLLKADSLSIHYND